MSEGSRGARGFSIFVKNLTFDINHEDLYKIFDKYGRIVDVFPLWAVNLKQHRGYAFVKFRYSGNAYAMIGVLNGRMVDGRRLTVKMAKPRKTPISVNPNPAREPISH
ncbi:serine/arginine-rich splicing factor SC35-like [Magnolia sinica]|uniref:serine/arginine-rich splicing factor SC35-like n=1 Tax=Magnolia sinica TaxID=86752 RepID=UPI002657E092|nr:serine/arginine-rich splicing factor SC35-like [Magnolia sinica]